MEDILFGLNESQTEAVTTTEGFVRVIAGAGSGKTRALTHRFAYLVNDLGVLPGNILCVTFTNKAANEMRQRIHALTGDNDTGYINTFHGFCVNILQEDSHAISYPKSFMVLDNSDIDEMLKIIYEERGLTLRDRTFGSARDMFEMRKCISETSYYLDMINLPIDELHQKYLDATETDDILFYGYLYQERKTFAVDYNDLIILSLHIFQEHPDIALKWQKRLEYIEIDEFQDIDPLQYKLMEVLCGYHKNLFIVGDPDQTIYTWRGANVKYLLDFDKHFPGTKTIMMLENYRSTPEILKVCNSLISKNKQRLAKDLSPVLEPGVPVVCHLADDSVQEATWIVKNIETLHQMGVPYRDITCLYRAHYVTRTIEEVFLKSKIPYTIYSGVQFFGRMEIKDALCYLRMIVYKDDLSFRRIANVPKRNLGVRRMKFLEDYTESNGGTLYEALLRNSDNELFKGTKAQEFISMIEKFSSSYEDKTISEVLGSILHESGYEKMLRTEGSQERLDNLAELKQSIFEFETSAGEETDLESYLKSVSLLSNMDVADTSDKVKLMTVHSAKGLEFPYVFLCSMSEGIFPSKKTNSLEGMEEERRLAFVAMSRAEKGLYISEAAGRNFDGSPRYPSRFILDIDPSLLSYTEAPKASLISETLSYINLVDSRFRVTAEQDLFRTGDRIKHKAFGSGTIREVNMDKNAYTIQFDDMPTERQISFRVKLEKE
ncbi:ATP-dependent helicase [Oribacterium sp. WCC10]|uniref:ATP-dependent helicase n=1 Tax=Oribacterium sp. WCC10 TaxID=1855343 RepID=UPI0008F2895F|nr:UvrD-helicase domain-containing protein [Oribacterium sp. WCC10]SFG49431.1 DNA helicase-2 / ATP-dependent DNA helicase PcrA [Oribacterium sp. WCC10]